MSRVPLRTLLIGLLLSTVALAVAVTSLAGVAALRGYLLDRVDDQLEASGSPGPAPDRPDRGRGRDRFDGPAAFVTGRYAPDGTLLVGRSGAGDDEPDLPVLDAATAVRLDGPPFTVDGTGGRGPWRARVDVLPDGTSTLVALPLGDVDDTVHRLLLIDLAIGLLALVGVGLLGRAAVQRGLRPLVAVESTAEAVAAGDLSVRVPEADPRTEVGSLAQSFNAMVDRFESAFRAQQASEADARASEERMRRFVGDASHELRTPLTSVRGYAELYRQGAVPDADMPRVMRRVEDEATRMGGLVEDLLLLARLDQQRPLERVPVDLLTVVADVVADAAAVTDSEVRLTPPTGPAPVVRGDDARLRQVVANLVGNAVAHTPAGTVVQVSLTGQEDAVLLEVRDDGPGMAPDVAARVFERFYRADTARTRSSGGSGLGLSIVAALVAAHGGEVSVDSEPGRGSTFRVRLPRT